MVLVKKLEMVQVCFILDLEGTRDQKKLKRMKNLHGSERKMFHNLSDVMFGPSTRGHGFNVTLGTMTILELSLTPRSSIFIWWDVDSDVCCGLSTWSTFTLH